MNQKLCPTRQKLCRMSQSFCLVFFAGIYMKAYRAKARSKYEHTDLECTSLSSLNVRAIRFLTHRHFIKDVILIPWLVIASHSYQHEECMKSHKPLFIAASPYQSNIYIVFMKSEELKTKFRSITTCYFAINSSYNTKWICLVWTNFHITTELWY